MSSLSDIPVSVPEAATGMAAAVLSELADFLQALAAHDKTHSIDLHSLPMNTADRSELQAALGQGEVEIQLNSLGQSQLYETAYAGIWWVRHFDTEGRLISELIDICSVPTILIAHQDDITLAAQTLKQIATGRQADD